MTDLDEHLLGSSNQGQMLLQGRQEVFSDEQDSTTCPSPTINLRGESLDTRPPNLYYHQLRVGSRDLEREGPR
jgi:hypothetical protein